MSRESEKQARDALHKLMHERVTNFDRGAVVHWAERGYYALKSDYEGTEKAKKDAEALRDALDKLVNGTNAPEDWKVARSLLKSLVKS